MDTKSNLDSTSFRFLWLDLEMSGLNPDVNQILELACILTDGKCENIVPGPQLIICATEQHLKTMDQWNTSHHFGSGLAQKCISSNLSTEQAQQQVLQFLQKHNIKERQLILAGNSIHNDKLFLRKHMPRLDSFLHYRILDVSTLKTLVDIHQPGAFFAKKGSHRALDDIKESIGELQHYVKLMFNK